MIIDQIGNHTLYPFGTLWAKAFEFIQTLSPETKDGKYPLLDDDLFIGIDSYETKARADAKLETHQTYVDIQLLLSGSESLEVFPKNGLTVSEPYDAEKDAEFYQPPAEAPIKLTLNPGQFVVFFPEDAHMPCLMNDHSAQPVQKVVVKLRAAQLSQ